MKVLGLNGKPLEASGKVFLPPSAGDDFKANVLKVNTPSGELIDVSEGFISIPLVKNGFIFLNWDITTNGDLELSNYAPEIIYVYMPSVNVNKGMVTMDDMFGTGYIMAADNWIKYDTENRTLAWTDAFKQTDYAGTVVWGSKSGHSTIITF